MALGFLIPRIFFLPGTELIQLNKFHIVVSFICLAALRIAIGFHFFDQGHQKFQEGGFDSTYFLQAADGPFAPLYHNALPDYDGKIRLCFDPLQEGRNKINPETTLKVWEAYKNYIVDQLINLEDQLVRPRAKRKDQIETMDPESEEYLIAVAQFEQEEKLILAIRESRKYGSANRIFEDYKSRLINYFAANEEEINYHFLTEDRLDGFQRDFQSTKPDAAGMAADNERENRMKQAAENVNRLRDQIDSIESDRKKAAAAWLAAIEGLWEGFEMELLNMVPLDDETQARLALSKPYESETISMVNRIVPYFDTTIGILLIVGLFTRLAAFAGGAFLISILMSQSAILGEFAAPTTILYLIETLAIFTIFATCAGRYAGLDYFIHAAWTKIANSENEDLV